MPVPVADLPVKLPEDVDLRPARQPARPASDLDARRLPAMRRRRRGARPTRWTRSSIRPGISPASPIRGTRRAPTDAGGRRPLPAGRPVYRRHRARDPAPALFALLHPGDAQGRAARPRRALRRPVHAGHGGARDLSGADGAWVSPDEIRIEGMGAERRAAHARRRRAGRRSAPIEKMSKSKRNIVDPDDIIATYGADTARWFMLSDSPPDRDVIWTEEGVQGAAKFVQRLWRLVGELAGAGRAGGDARRRPSGERRALAVRKAAHRALIRRRGGHRAAALQPLRRPYLRARQPALGRRSARSRRRSLPARPRARPSARRPTSWCRSSAPFMPHLAETVLGGARPRRRWSPRRAWPQADRALVVEDVITLAGADQRPQARRRHGRRATPTRRPSRRRRWRSTSCSGARGPARPRRSSWCR